MKKTMNISKKIKTLLPVVVAIVLSACQKLEEDPKNFIAPTNFYKTETDAIAAVTSAYQLTNNFSYYMVMHILVDNASDNSNEGRANILAKDIDQFTPDSGNGQINNLWQSIFVAVNAANAVTKYVNDIPMDPTRRSQIVAEGQFLRALHYYNLVRLFGAVPLNITPTESLEGLDKPRTPVDEVYKQIIKDLEEAVSVLPTSYPATFTGRATKYAAQSLLASVYLTRKDWQKARDNSKAVMDALPNALFADIDNLWKVANQDAPEFIFSLQAKPFTQVLNYMNKRFMPRIITGSGIAWVEMPFFNSFAAGDKRKDVSVWTSITRPTGQIVAYPQWSDPFPHIGKYQDGGIVDVSNGDSETNSPIIRYAEIVLIHAEAENELNGPAQAFSSINKIRRRAFKENINSATPQPHDLAGLNQVQFRDAVAQERSWELCFEWHRWFDLVRTGKLIEVMKPTRPNVSERNYLYPIPQSQIDANPNLKPNNPGF